MGLSRRAREIKDIACGYWKSFFLSKKEDEKPIDFVVTWVDGDDPKWQEERARVLNQTDQEKEDNHRGRYQSWDAFRYWFRAVEEFAPWVNKVFFVTWGHLPKWLNQEAPKLRIVNHNVFIPEEYLPTFNSNTIELNLFRIPDLAEQFVYFNDDVFLARPVQKQEFFLNGKPRHTAIATPWINRNRDLPYYFYYNVYGEVNAINNITECIHRHPEKWFSHLYGKCMKENIYPYRNGVLPGMFFSHMGVPFMKSSMKSTWEKYSHSCEQSSQYKVRDIHQLAHQLFSVEDIINGNFEPSANDWGAQLNIENTDGIKTVLQSKRYKMFCLFDTNYDDVATINRIDADLKGVFEARFPNKSSFEL